MVRDKILNVVQNKRTKSSSVICSFLSYQVVQGALSRHTVSVIRDRVYWKNLRQLLLSGRIFTRLDLEAHLLQLLLAYLFEDTPSNWGRFFILDWFTEFLGCLGAHGSWHLVRGKLHLWHLVLEQVRWRKAVSADFLRRSWIMVRTLGFLLALGSNRR